MTKPEISTAQRPMKNALWPIPALLTLAVGLGMWQTGRWSSLGVPIGQRHFGDLRVVTTAAECAASDPSWSIQSVPCLPEVAIYNYPSLWAQMLGKLGVDRTHTELIAALFIVIFAITLGYLTRLVWQRTRSALSLILMSFCGLSPVVLLAYERGNIDLLVYGILVLGLALSIGGAARASGGILGLATGLKLFPIGSALVLFVERPIRRSAIAIYVFVAGIGLLFALRDLSLISSRTPLLDGAAFGAAELPLLLSNQLALTVSPNVLRVTGFALFLFVLALIILAGLKFPRNRCSRILHRLTDNIQHDRVAALLIVGGGGTFLVAYLAGPSFDYRLIFLIPCVAGLLRLHGRGGNIAALAVALQLLLSYSTFVGPAQYISDLMLLILAPALTYIVFRVAISGCHRD
jgi:hypothetical protein